MGYVFGPPLSFLFDEKEYENANGVVPSSALEKEERP